MIRVKWDVEELVALIDIYNREKAGKVLDLDIELEHLSAALRRRAEVFNIPHDEKFRNLNGMKMMYHNVEYVSTWGDQGLSDASSLMREVYYLCKTNQVIFNQILSEFKHHYNY